MVTRGVPVERVPRDRSRRRSGERDRGRRGRFRFFDMGPRVYDGLQLLTPSLGRVPKSVGGDE